MKKIVITIDVEGHKGIDPVGNLIWGNTKTGRFGIDTIMDICDKYNVKGIFFVDMAASWKYGDDKIKQVVKHIIDRNHDVGVHIHPDHMMDKERLFLWQYSYEEQLEIISKCTDKFEEFTGKKPTAFRAGKYGVNYDTLDILNKQGYKIDMSNFAYNKWCSLEPIFTVNNVKKYKSLIEVPVTIYKSLSIFKYQRYDKLDINGLSLNELNYVIRKYNKSEQDMIITIFLHSFSFLNWRKSVDNPTVNKSAIKRFDKLLKNITNSDMQVIDLQQIEDIYPYGENNKEYILENKNIFMQLHYNLYRLIYLVKQDIKILKRLIHNK